MTTTKPAMTRASKASLMAGGQLPEDNVTVTAGTIRVRGLCRLEAGRVQGEDDAEKRETLIISLGLVDPELTQLEARAWLAVAPAGDVERVSARIAELSGLLTGSAKEQYKSLRS